MENLNDRIRKMFEMVVQSSLSNNILQILQQPENPQQQQQQPKTGTTGPPNKISSTSISNLKKNRSSISLRSKSQFQIRSRPTNRFRNRRTKSENSIYLENSLERKLKGIGTATGTGTGTNGGVKGGGKINSKRKLLEQQQQQQQDDNLPFASGLNVFIGGLNLQKNDSKISASSTTSSSSSTSTTTSASSTSSSSTSLLLRHYDCSVYFIYCLKHHKIAVTKPSKRQAIWMPFMPMHPIKSWQDNGLAGLLIILSNGDMDLLVELQNSLPFKERFIIELATIQLPQTMELINRITWMVKLDVNASTTTGTPTNNPNSANNTGHSTTATKFKCCQDNDSLIWIDEQKLNSGSMNYLWGPELIDIYRTHILKKQPYSTPKVPTNSSKSPNIPQAQTNSNTTIGSNGSNNSNNNDWSSTDLFKCNFIEYDLDSAFQFLPKNPPRNDEEDMLLSTSISEKDIERLYSDFLDHCFPAMSMTYHSFNIYMQKNGFQFNEKKDLTNLFFAFNYNSNGCITFPELLMGLACLDCHSINNETRAKFIMRFYDFNKRNYLTQDDIRSMLKTIHPDLTNQELEEKLKEILWMMGVQDPQKIVYKKFVEAVGHHKFRGTSKLCRTDRPVFQMITQIIFSRKKNLRRELHEQQQLKLSTLIDCNYSGICSNCKEKQPYLEDYLLRINKFGFVSMRIKLRKLDLFGENNNDSPQPTSKSHHLHHLPHNNKSKSKQLTSNNLKDNKNKSLSTSKSSTSSSILFQKIFDHQDDIKNLAWNLIHLIREFSLKKGDTKHPHGFMSTPQSDRKKFYEWLLLIEKRLIKLFELESRCCQIQSPVYIIGDIHGNLEDLLTLENVLWKCFPLLHGQLLFLGDYVDRGKWSIECVLYLFSLKILIPEKICMLRGNHEVRTLQQHYSYKLELLNKYGDDFGLKIWDLTNRIFDRLPLSAIIDDSIYCAHGGIPRSTKDLLDIQRLDLQISDPEHNSPIAWEILWSDPIHQQQFLELACLLNYTDDNNNNNNNGNNSGNNFQQDFGGFLPNRKRGTAFVFNEDAATIFLKQNGLTHIIRAHEVPSAGFFFHFGKKCTTIFSSSHYCGNNNECAVAFVDGDLIRIIRIDTSNNRSATD